MRTKIERTLLSCTLIVLSVTMLPAQMVDNALGQELVATFPDLTKGYIDLNGNGRKDQTDELDESIPDSIVRDSVLQAQEVLDFVLRYYRYIPTDRLKSVRKSLGNPRGAITEIIGLRYTRLMDEAIVKREELGDEILFLTPSALQEARSLMEEKIASLGKAFRKEGSDGEKAFLATENELYTLLDRGYPIPEAMTEEDRAVLESSLINTVIKTGSTPQRVRTAVRTLGKLKSDAALPYLTALLARPEFKKETAATLGIIGNRDTLPVIMKELEASPAPEVESSLVRSLGSIGGQESLERLLKLLDTARKADDRRKISYVLDALVLLSSRGSSDTKISSVFKDYLPDTDPSFRLKAVKGLAMFPRAGAADLLVPTLLKEKDRDVLIETIRSLNVLGASAAVRNFTTLLKDQSTDDSVRVEILGALGGIKEGAGALQNVLEFLGSSNQQVQSAAGRAVLSLYAQNPQSVTSSLVRALGTSTDERFLNEGSAALARLADGASAGSLLPILQKPYPEVKKNITWALCRVGRLTDAKIVEELRNLVSSETESLAVRINAARALGSIGLDSPQLKIWQTLVTIAKIRGEKYGMLRFYAVRSLGELGSTDPEVISAVLALAVKDSDQEIRKEAASGLRKLLRLDPAACEAIAKAAGKEEDLELKVRFLELLGDAGYAQMRDLAAPVLSRDIPEGMKKRVLYTLSRAGGEEAVSAIIDAAKDPKLSGYIAVFLEDTDTSVLIPLVSRRLRTENDEGVRSVLEALAARFPESLSRQQ